MKNLFNNLKSLKGVNLLLLTALCFAASTISTKMVYEYYPGTNIETLIFWSYGFSVGLASLFFLAKPTMRNRAVTSFKTDWRLIIALSVFGMINAITWFYAMSVMSGGVVALIDQISLLWAALFGILFLKEKFIIRELPGIIIAMIGLGIIFGLEGEVTLWGILALVVCHFFIALQGFLIKLYGKESDMTIISWLRGSFMFVCLTIGFLLFGNIDFEFNLSLVLIGGLGQICGLFLGRTFYNLAHNHTDLSKINFLLLLIPVLVLPASYFLLNEPIGLQKLAGMLLIIGGLFWFVWEQNKLKKS